MIYKKKNGKFVKIVSGHTEVETINTLNSIFNDYTNSKMKKYNKKSVIESFIENYSVINHYSDKNGKFFEFVPEYLQYFINKNYDYDKDEEATKKAIYKYCSRIHKNFVRKNKPTYDETEPTVLYEIVESYL